MSKEYWLKKEDDTEFGYIDQDGVSYRSPAEWLFTGIMGGCGCGSSEDLAVKAIELLIDFEKPHPDRRIDVYGQSFWELMAHWMDSVHLIEHGGSIGGAWLSEKGKQVHASVLTLLKKHG